MLLRRVFLQLEYTELAEQVDTGILGGCRAELILAIQNETSAPIRRKMCDAVAELARSSIGMYCYSSVCACVHAYYVFVCQ